MGRLFRASVTENKQVVRDHYLMTLRPLEKVTEASAGRFFMVSTDGGHDPLLRRPFSIHRVQGDQLQILIRVAGKGTGLLSGKKPGDVLDLLGPLGNGFPPHHRSKTAVLVAGGLGIAPLFALAEMVRCTAKKPPLLFYGARTEEEIFCMDELQTLGIDPVLSTDDGTRGKKGTIVDIFKKHVSRKGQDISDIVLYACGPGPMLKALSSYAVKKGISGHVALEQNMACGIGTCLGCVVNTVDGYKRVCREGPVFPMEDIVWEG